MHAVTRALGTAVAGGAGALLWALLEARHGFAVRTHSFETRALLPLSILHISDLHLTPRDVPRIEFVRSLAALSPDFVVLTGDNLGSADGLAALQRALEPLFRFPGAFVFGSNDYFSAQWKNPLRYLWKPKQHDRIAPDLPADALRGLLRSSGWLDLNNARHHVELAGMDVSLVGVNDPHVRYDLYPEPDGDHGDLQIAVLHAPYRHALDAAWQDSSDLALAGHTHGGQVCVPFYGALINNSDIPPWRASGLQGWPGLRPDGAVIEPMRAFSPARNEAAELHGTSLDRRSMWLNISAGLGTSRYAPIRFACRPEVSLLHVVPRGFLPTAARAL